MFKHLEEVLQRYGQRVSSLYSTYAPEATGRLADVSFRVNHKGVEYEVELELEKYWRYVEEGRSAGKRPPVEPILEWIRAKPVIPRERDGNLPTEEQLAFLISRSIGEKGTQGQHVLQRANEETEDEMRESILNAFIEDLEEDWDKVLMFLR